MLLYQILAYTIHGKIQKLPDGSFSVSDIQDYFNYIIKKKKAVIDNPPIRIYVNQIQNRTTLRKKTGYYLEILTSKTIQLLGSTESRLTKDENGKNVPRLEITKVVLLYCNIFNNNSQQNSRVFSARK